MKVRAPSTVLAAAAGAVAGLSGGAARAAAPRAAGRPARPGRRRRAHARPRRPGVRRTRGAGRRRPRLTRRRRLMDVAAFDTGLLQATIARALRRGGDFAEVFVEDRDSLGLRLEDGRIEQTSGGREVGAAVRLLSGEHTYYAYSDALDEAGLAAAADAVAAAVRAGAAGPEVIDLGRGARRPRRATRCVTPPDDVAIARKAELVRAGDEAARAAGAEIVAGHRRLRRHAPEGAHRQLARRPRVRRPHAHALHRAGRGAPRRRHPDRPRDRRRQRRASSWSTRQIARTRGARPPPRRRASCSTRSRRRSAPCPSCWPTASAARCSTRPAATASRPTPSPRAPASTTGKMGEVVAAPIVSAYDDGALPNGWGSQAFDDEGVPTQKTLVIEDGRLTGYLYDRLRAREAGAAPTGNGRRQSFRHVPDPAHDDHVHRPRRRHRRGHHRGDAARASTPRAWPAGRSSRPAATSSSASPRATSSRTAGHDAAARRHPRRQRHRHPHEDRHDRRRLRREDRHLRQGRPGRAGRHRPGHAAHRRDDGGRDGLMFDVLDAVLERAARARRRGRRGLRRAFHLAPHQGVPAGGRAAHRRAAPRRGRARLLAAAPWATPTPRT